MIGYDVIVRDNIGGYEICYGYYEDLHEAIEWHKKIKDDKEFLRYVLSNEYGMTEIDQYYLDNPHKRFDVVIEVDYE